MDKATLTQLKERLEKEKIDLEKMLESFTEKKNTDWETTYPDISPGESLEEQADEVEEYENLLPVERALESKLKNVILALEKIDIGTYGKCENCDKDIQIERLKASPEARTCNDCK